jgi:FtsP/CotA-like multicopper oxidase with cupredoxin domain
VKRGEELRVRLLNELAEPTSVHWHGVRLPNTMDGVPQLTQSAIAPGASFDYRFKPPDAGTFWYHAPVGAQVAQGLYGALIVEEEQPVSVDRDILLVLGTAADGADARAPVLVNGLLRPDIAVKSGERLRLRLINATATRSLALKVEGHAAWVMAIDGQPAEPFLARDSRVGLGPGNRVVSSSMRRTRAGRSRHSWPVWPMSSRLRGLPTNAGATRAMRAAPTRLRCRPMRCRRAWTSKARSRQK